MFIPRQEVISTISEAILNKNILLVKYQHTDDKEIVLHKIAPFDIGSTNPNPNIRKNSDDRLYAFSFTHKDDSGQSKPMVCAFNINYFIEIQKTDDVFDEVNLAKENQQRTKYDYRTCKFALVPERNWFQECQIKS